MSDAASALLKQMKNEKQKQGRITGRDYYTKLVINKTKRRTLIAALILVFTCFAVFLYSHHYAHTPWLVVTVPVVFLGSLLCLIPPTEEWRYAPWQTNPQKYERHFLD